MCSVMFFLFIVIIVLLYVCENDVSRVTLYENAANKAYYTIQGMIFTSTSYHKN